MAELVATGLFVPEGPVVLPDGGVAFVEQRASRVSVCRDGVVEPVATAPGAWNGATLGSDGFLYGAQNGGVVGGWRPQQRGVPGIERIGFDGSVAPVATTIGGVAALAPNDLAFGPDGWLYFTDPAHGYDPVNRGEAGRLFAVGPDGTGKLLLQLDPCYCNGIAFLADGTLLWVESYGRHVCTLGDDRRRQVLCQLPEDHVPDGLAVATDGRLFIATVTSKGVTVVSPDGEVLDHLAVADDALVTNCCFDGNDLWVTDFGPDWAGQPDGGRLWRLETDAIGAPLHQGEIGGAP